MSEMPTPVAEIVTFRLIEGASATEFVKAAQAIEPILKGTGHVLSRCLSQGEDGLWTDHITWTSMAAAKSTAEKMMAEPKAAPMMQMINPDHVEMRHAPIQYQQE